MVDEIDIRERTDVSYSNTKDDWQTDTRLLAKFINSLEAGNIDNKGIKIVKFAIKRRKVNDSKNITLGFLPFVNNVSVEYIDNTQQSQTDYIYSIVPVGENNLEGLPNEIDIKTDFVGWWIVDKLNLNDNIICDKFVGGEPEIQTQLNEDISIVETINNYPHIFKFSDKQYHTFPLSALIIPEENKNNFDKYQEILLMLNSNKPFVVKSGDGDIYIAHISNPRKATLQNNYKDRQYMNVVFNCTEIMSEKEYHSMFIGGE